MGAGLALVIVLAAAHGCQRTEQPPLPPPWPASSADLVTVLRATATELALPVPLSVDERGVPTPAAKAPFVRAREGASGGLLYIEVVLGDVDIDASLPMVLMLHGRGDRPKVPGGPFACVTMPMRIIIPRAPDPQGPGYTWLSVRVAEGRTDEITRQIAKRADQLAALLEDVSATRPTLGRPIVTGFSQGALLTFALAMTHPALVATALPLSGWLPPGLWPETPANLPPVRALHGADDQTIPLPPTREALAYLRELGAAVDLVEFEGVGHEISPAMNEQFERWLEEALRAQAPALSARPRDTSVELGAASPCR